MSFACLRRTMSNNNSSSSSSFQNKPCLVCNCESCTCGDDCQCTESLCLCQASSIVNSLARTRRQRRNNNNNNNDDDDHDTTMNESLDPLYPAPSLDANTTSTVRKVHLLIQGMTCSMCQQAIERAVQQQLDGIQSIQIHLATDLATVMYDESKISIHDIVNAIEAVGYHVESVQQEENKQQQQQQVELLIHGMTCTMCSQAVQNAVQQVNGVIDISVSLATDTAKVVYDSTTNNTATTTVEDIIQAIENVGYDVEQQQQVSRTTTDSSSAMDNSVEERWQQMMQRQEAKVRARRTAFLWSLVGCIPILLLTMVLPYAFSKTILNRHIQLFHRSIEIEAILLWILATPIQFVCGWEFYKMAYFGILNGNMGMDVLVALGTTASYGYALQGLDTHAAHFFETSAVLICFVLAGKWMQALAVRRTSQAMTQLMQLQSTSALKVTPTVDTNNKKFDPLQDPYKEETVPIQQVHMGDLVKVIRGASIPADGRVLYGEISVDESMVTGESVPVLKTPGSIVLGGTICVESGSGQQDEEQGVGAAFVQVTGVGSSTALSQIMQLVQEAQTRSVPIQSFADRISSIFVPTVCTISLLTYMTWYALCNTQVVPSSWYQELGEDPATFSLMFAIACLVISCPCALGLATPTAVMVGTGVGARIGVLMKGGEALEIASKVDAVVFDKTGTLTKGKFKLTPARVSIIR